MKRKLIVLTFMLSFSLFDTTGINAQNDAFFEYTSEAQRASSNVGQGFYFENLNTQPNGIYFEEYVINGDVPLTNGMLLMTVTGLIYLMNKRRKEKEK